MIPERGIGNLDKDFVSKTLPKLILKEVKSQKINIEDKNERKKFIHDTTLEVAKKFRSRDKREDEYTSKFGKVYGLFERRNEFLENYMETARDGMFRLVVGESKHTKALLAKGELKKASIIERIVSGQRYMSTNIKDVLSEIVAEKRGNIPTPVEINSDEPEVVTVSPDLERLVEDSSIEKPKRKKKPTKVKAVKEEPVQAPVSIDSLMPRGKNGRFLPRKNTTVEAQTKFFGSEIEKYVTQDLVAELQKLPENIRIKAIAELEKLSNEGVTLDKMIADELKNMNVTLDDMSKVLTGSERRELDQEKRSKIEATKDHISKDNPTSLFTRDKKDKKPGLLANLKDKMNASLIGMIPAATILGAVAAITGGLVWAAADGITGYLKAEDWGVSKLSAVVSSAFAGTSDGMVGAFKNAGKWALLGAGYGLMGGPVGVIAGGLIGAAIGGILGWIGGERIAKFVRDFDVSELWEQAKAEMLSGFAGLKKLVPQVLAGFDGFIHAVSGIMDEAAREWFGIDPDKMRANLQKDIESVKDWFKNLSFSSFIDGIREFDRMTATGMGAISNSFNEFLVKIFDPTVIITKGKDLVDGVKNYVGDLLTSFVGSVKDWFKNLFSFEIFTGKKQANHTNPNVPNILGSTMDGMLPPEVSAAIDQNKTKIRTDDNASYGKLIGLRAQAEKNADEKLKRSSGAASVGIASSSTNVNSGNSIVNTISMPVYPWNPTGINQFSTFGR